MEEEKENTKNLDYQFNELKTKYEKDRQLLSETVNQKKDLNETVITLEKKVFYFFLSILKILTLFFLKNSDIIENLNTQTNMNNQLKTQYSNLLKVGLFINCGTTK